VRSNAVEHGPFAQAFKYQSKFIMFEVTQSAMDEFRRPTAGAGGKIILLQQKDLQSPHGGIAGHSGPVDPPTDNNEVPFSLVCGVDKFHLQATD